MPGETVTLFTKKIPAGADDIPFRTGEIVKKIMILTLAIIFLLVAGCTTGNPGNLTTTKAIPSVAATTAAASLPGKALLSSTVVTLGTSTSPFTASLDSFHVSTTADNSTQISIYVATKNTGKQPVKLVWFSKLTDKNGNAYGGIGVSHGGQGAKTAMILPNATETARDFVIVRSPQQLAALSEGSTLDVYFMEQAGNTAVPFTPDFHVAWALNKIRFG